MSPTFFLSSTTILALAETVPAALAMAMLLGQTSPSSYMAGIAKRLPISKGLGTVMADCYGQHPRLSQPIADIK